MLAFYYQAQGIKSHRNTIHESTSIHSKPRTSHQTHHHSKPKQSRLNHSQTLHEATPSHPLLPIEKNEPQQCEPKLRIFKNMAIKQKVREMEVWRAEERIRRKLAQEKVETKDYESSVQQYLAKKIRQNMDRSQNERAAEKPQKTSIRRYRTLNEQQPHRRSHDYLNTLTLSQRQEEGPDRPPVKRSNLIGREESLLGHILRRQREFQEKSLRIVATKKGNRKAHQESSMRSTGERWGSNSVMADSQTHLLTPNYKGEYIIAMRAPKQQTETLLPWEGC